MERLAVAVTMLMSLAAASGWMRLPVAAFGCAVVLLAYRERIAGLLGKFLLLWLVFSAAVGAGRYWAGTTLLTLAVDTASSIGLALGVACAALLVVRGRASELLAALDRLHTPREASYALLSVIGLLPRVAALGTRQMALLELKGLAGAGEGLRGIPARFRAYPRIVAPLFGQLLSQQLAHARSLGLRGFFEPRAGDTDPGSAPFGSAARLWTMRGWIVIALLIADAAVWIGVGTWIR
jgi:hypothetical protein